jgi:gas vesicle protein
MSTSSGFLTGALCGLVIGLLVAPKKGSDLRGEIVDTADQWKNKLDGLVGKAQSNVDDLRGMLERNIEGMTEEVRNRILTILDDASEMAYSSNNRISNGVSR